MIFYHTSERIIREAVSGREGPNTRSRRDYALQASSEINSLSWIDLPPSNYENAITAT